MVAISQRFQRTVFNNKCFIYFQQSAIFKSQADAQVGAVGGEDFFYITFGVGGQLGNWATAASTSAK